MLRHYGVRGIQTMVRDHVAMMQELVDWIRRDDRFELMAPAPLTLACFSHVDGDERTQSIMEAANATGQAAFSHATLNGRYVIRFSIGQWRTNRAHVKAAWELLQSLSAS